MLHRSGRIKSKMANIRPVEPDQETEPDQKHFNFEEARGLPNPRINFSSVSMGHSVTQSNRGAIPEIIDQSAGRSRGFIRINSETIQNRYKRTNG